MTEGPGEGALPALDFFPPPPRLYGRLTATRRWSSISGGSTASMNPLWPGRIDAIFERLEMSDFRDRRCDRLSHRNEAEGVHRADTWYTIPPVMIFDEPTLGLDVMAARTIAGFIRECRNQGKTVIFSTHVMSEVEKLCDHIGIIHGGKLLAEGTLADLRQRFGMQDLEDIFVKVVEP